MSGQCGDQHDGEQQCPDEFERAGGPCVWARGEGVSGGGEHREAEGGTELHHCVQDGTHRSGLAGGDITGGGDGGGGECQASPDRENQQSAPG